MRIILGIGGGISSYKSADLASRLVKQGHELYSVMTASATDFVGPLTLRALSGHPVGVSSTDEPMGPLSHVRMAHWADRLIIAPLTQNLLSRLALGLSSDLLSLVFQGYRGPVLVAPAMEPEMWESPQTQARMRELLVARQVAVIGPNAGRMASGLQGTGRMAEPEEIMEALWRSTRPQTLTGVRVVVTAGPTWEHFDPVRLLTNPSTGTMGVLVARELSARGADVLVVCGPGVATPPYPGVRYLSVVSACDMYAAVAKEMPETDMLIGAAAVSDFRPVVRSAGKMRKSQVNLSWEMTGNPDIMAEMGRQYHHSKVLVGFAAETGEVLHSAIDKANRKHLHVIVANQVGPGIGFGNGDYLAAIVRPTGSPAVLERLSKAQLAENLAVALEEMNQEMKGDMRDV